METRDFQIDVLERLSDLKVEQSSTTIEVKGIVARLDRLNGTVARHEKEFGEIKVHIAERDNQCPLVVKVEDRVRSLEDSRTAEVAAEKTDSKWMRWLWPFVWAAIGIFGLLVLQNSQLVLRLFLH